MSRNPLPQLLLQHYKPWAMAAHRFSAAWSFTKLRFDISREIGGTRDAMYPDFFGSNLVLVRTGIALRLLGQLKDVQAKYGALNISSCVSKSITFGADRVVLNSVKHLGFDPAVDFDLPLSLSIEKGVYVWSINEKVNKDFQFKSATIHIDSVTASDFGDVGATQGSTAIFCRTSVRAMGYSLIGFPAHSSRLYEIKINAKFDALPATESLWVAIELDFGIELPERYFDIKYFLDKLPLRLLPAPPDPHDPAAQDANLGLSMYELADFLHDDQAKRAVQRIASELIDNGARKGSGKGHTLEQAVAAKKP